MQYKHLLKAGATVLGTTLALAVPVTAASAAPKAQEAAAPPTVSVSVVGRTTTLLKPTSVQVKPGWITRGGGKCVATTAQGALNLATKGDWQGSWSAKYHEYFITGILGLTESSSKYYWELLVNGKAASSGACDTKLKTGDKVVFKVVKG